VECWKTHAWYAADISKLLQSAEFRYSKIIPYFQMFNFALRDPKAPALSEPERPRSGRFSCPGIEAAGWV
jgi:hypothetical protein